MLRRKTVNTVFIILTVMLLGLSFFTVIPLTVYLLVFLSWFLITACGSFFIRWNYHYKSLHSNKSIKDNLVAITFDDGPHPEYTPQVLELLKKHNAKATFFCVGKQVQKNPDLFKAIIDGGHTVGNHTYTHVRSFGFFNEEEVSKELLKTIDLVKNISGLQMKLYRPAFGVTNPSIEKSVKKLNLTSIGWNVRSLDTTPRNENMVLKRITSKISKGDIVLLHDTSEKSVRVLERLLLFLDEKKLESVTVDQILQIKAYE
ncbi:polysaccharide deacetylase family protein [Maribacter sp. MMG018]|uniref:polysaccharide deacetylase family protein n=1 Tax=Maribacter sp. MMG018 TaxID=2822688 RepID=UPI001B3670B0|nr:polysaccharide deacetylase family protein [Maribacter sp. MMG018]MBQ4913726.1 polysaccharide deacetylase family protein [Maribacter sp. MMG018]